MASSLIDVCRFNPTAGGTTDWTYSSAVTGYQGPSAAGAINGATYSYRAESADLTQWEVGAGVYNSGTGVITRATVLFNSSGTTSKINFSGIPQIAVVALAEDLTFAKGIFSTFTNSVGADIALNNIANFFDGPSVAQGSAGTWFVSGTVSLADTSSANAAFGIKLWDGTTIIASAAQQIPVASNLGSISISGIISSPAGNLRISCRDFTSTNGLIKAVAGGSANASTITAIRIA